MFRYLFVIFSILPPSIIYAQNNPDLISADPRYAQIQNTLDQFSGIYRYQSFRPFVKNIAQNLFGVASNNEVFYDEEVLRFTYSDRVLTVEPFSNLLPVPFKLNDRNDANLSDDLRRKALHFTSDLFSFSTKTKNDGVLISYEYRIHIILDYSKSPQEYHMAKIYEVTSIAAEPNIPPRTIEFINEEDGDLVKLDAIPSSRQISPNELSDTEWKILGPKDDPLDVQIRFNHSLKLEYNIGQGYRPFQNYLSRDTSTASMSPITFHFFKDNYLYQFVIFIDREQSGKLEGHGAYRMIAGKLNGPSFEAEGQALTGTRFHSIQMKIAQ